MARRRQRERSLFEVLLPTGTSCGPTGCAESTRRSRTRPFLLGFEVRLPSVTATGRWRERGRIGKR